MEFSVTERLVTFDLLPREGNYATLKMVRELREALSFNDEENQILGFKRDGNQILWDDTREPEVGVKEIEISRTMAGVITTRFNELDSAGKLTMDHMGLFERFMELEQAHEEEKRVAEASLAKLLES